MTTLLRFDDADVVDHPLHDRYAGVEAGSAGPCPECDLDGVIDSVEPATFVQNQRCPGCGYRWQYRFRADGRIGEVRELGARRLDLLAPAPSDVGVILDLRDEVDAAAAPRARAWWRRSSAT